MSASTVRPTLLIIGAGNMGRAILGGALRAGVFGPSSVVVAEPNPAARDALPGGLTTFANAREALAHTLAHEDPAAPAQVLLAVKPQMLPEVAAELAPLLAQGPSRVVISILAGATAARIAEALSPSNPGHLRIIRAMPNLPALVGQGATAIHITPSARAGDDAFARALFTSIGPLVLTIDEPMMDAFTGVAGSGPAYLFYLAEAMTRAAVDLGFSPADADAMVRQTLLGAATLLAQSDQPPATLRANVTSKGGTTAAATALLEARGANAAFVDAIKAAQARGRELGR